MRSPMDLRRVIVPPHVVTVAEQSSHRLELVTDQWILCLNAVESDHVRGELGLLSKNGTESSPASR